MSMRWPFRSREPESQPRLPHARPIAATDDDEDILLAAIFVCSTCGRTDLAPAGDWDPPVCEECDAAINFDTELEELEEDDDDWDG